MIPTSRFRALRRPAVNLREHSRVCAIAGYVAWLSSAEQMLRKSRSVLVRIGVLAGVVMAAGVWLPASACAHGAIDPVASSYRAIPKFVPAGLRAKVVDGDSRLWLQVPSGESVVVLDYDGARYLRFDNGRVWANQNSQMYYFNETPPQTPPLSLRRTTAAKWVPVGGGNSYEWHDGRLQALAVESVAPGASYVGVWRIPLLVNGRHTVVSGTLRYRGAPSIVWFWPIVILVLCMLAAWRLQDARVDAAVGRAVAILALIGILLAAIGRGFHGRPGISGFGVFECAVVLCLAGWAASGIARRRSLALTLSLIAVVGFWEGLTLLPTLLHGYVLLAVPPLVGRIATVLCIGGAIAVLLPAVRLFKTSDEGETPQQQQQPPPAPPVTSA